MIACRECGTKNPAGSKFCNNCGSPLPPATKLICPNCQAANAATLLYCDNCGTRLVDTNLPESTPESSSSDLGRSLERFSLPSRPPGETANLDVVGEIPDWLKTGNTARQPEEFSWSAEEPPDEEAGEEVAPPAAAEPWLDEADQPAYRPGDDLPDWLMDETLREAFLSGREKSTDELFAAVQRERRRRAEAERESLPDWLSELGDADEPAATTETEEAQLGDVDDVYSEMPAAEPAAAAPAPEDELPAWLLGIEETLDEAITDEPVADDMLSDEALVEDSTTGETAPEAPFPTENTLDETLAGDISWGEEIAVPPLDDDAWLDEVREPAGEEDDSTPAWLLDAELEEEMAGWPEEESEARPAVDIPSWLQDLEDEEPADDLLTEEGLPGWLANLVDADAGSLPVQEEEPAAESSPPPPEPAGEAPNEEDDFAAWLAQMDVDQPAAETTRPQKDQPLPDDLPSWLSESLDDLPSGEFAAAEAAHEYEEEEAAGDIEPFPLEATAGEPGDEPAEERPEWLEEVLGDTGTQEPEAHPAPFGVTGELRDIPSQLVGDELPDWLEQDLQALPPASAEIAPSEVPDWLQPVRRAHPEEVLDLGELAGEAAAEAEWSDLLSSLPAPGAEGLSEAHLPEWLEALRPADLPPASAEENGVVESEGPLAGLRGVVHIEPVVVRPHTSDRPVAHLEMSREQQQQVALLRQLMADERKPPVTVAKPGRLALAPAGQLLLALLLLAAVLAGLLMPPPVETVLPEAPGAVQAQEAINGAAGRPVLVVFEYSPAMAGELTPQARQILEWLAANGSPAVLASQSAAGITLGEQLASEVAGLNSQSLGFLPGEALGLRQLTGCLQAAVDCEQLYGREVDSAVRTMLPDLGLIVVLAAERDNLVSWVEQVAAFSDLPVVAAVTQSLAPIAAPYYATGQFAGLVAGLPALAQVATADPAGAEAAGPDLNTRLWAQTLGQWLVVALLVVGNLFWLIKGALARR